jgi:RND family efflux transporter MFP subunit
MSRSIVRLVVGLSVTSLFSPLARGQGMPPTLVETGTVTKMEFHNQITLVGKSEAISSSRIVAEVAGRVIRIDASEGTRVERGSLLVRIDPDKIQYALDAKRAEAAQAEAQADLSRRELERSENLYHQNLISDGEIDAARANARRASEWFNQIHAEQKQLELDLENCGIRAPYAGYTVRKLTDVGEWVNPGTPVYEMVDLDIVKVILDLPERHFGHVRIGSTVTLSATSDPVPVEGRVTGVAPSAGQDTHTFPVIVEVDNRDHRLGGGMLVRATLSLDDVFTSLAVSKDAVVRQGNQTMVYTIADGKAVPIPVVTTSTEGNMIAVRGEGLGEGMPVVVRGNERIFPGSPVRTAGTGKQGPAQEAEGGNSATDSGAETSQSG